MPRPRSPIETAGGRSHRHPVACAVEGVSMVESETSASQVAAALRAGADVAAEARAVFAVIRDSDGRLADLRILYGNGRYWAMVGLDPEAALGRTFNELGRPLDWQSGLAGLLADAVASQQPVVRRRLVVRAQLGPHAGEERWVEVEVASLDEVVVLAFQDVTDQVAAAERQAREARRTAALSRFLRTAVEPAADRRGLLEVLAREAADCLDGFCLIAAQEPAGDLRLVAAAGGGPDVEPLLQAAIGGRIEVSEEARGLFLRGEDVVLPSLSESIRQRMRQLLESQHVPGAIADRVTSIVGAAVRSGSQPIGRLHVYRLGGPPFEPDDLRAVTAMTDAAALVFEHLQMEAEQATARARFEALFEQAPIAMVFLAEEGTLRVNRAAVELLGRPAEELARFAFGADAPWVPPGDAERFAAFRADLRAGRLPASEVVDIVRPSGERRQVQGTAIPITTADGRRLGVIVALIDLTDRLALEAQFAQAQKMEAIGRLAGGIAHDFANVLMAILGYAELVAADARAGRVSPDDADQIVVATRRAVELTSRLRDLARKRPAAPERADIAELVRDVLVLGRRLVPESIEVVADVAAVSPVLVDRAAFEQALLNLVVNAVDAMPGGGRLTVATRLDPSDPERPVVVAVADTGRGMDEATRQRIFEPFFTTKPAGIGTGLGLSMVYTTVERAGGRIEVVSEPGSGATFTIRLPPAPPERADRPAATAAVHEPNDLPRGSETILLLEDDPVVRAEVGRVLGRLGYEVVAAGRPSEAFEIARSRPVDLVLADVVLPEMPGPAVVERLRERWPDLPVVFMSGYRPEPEGVGAAGLATKLSSTGRPDLTVDKPLAVAELARVVRAAFDAARRG